MMKRLSALWGSLLLLPMMLATAGAQDTLNFPHLGKVERFDPQLDRILDRNAAIEVISSGFDWTEGPVWVPGEQGFLLFCDIPANSVFRWVEGEGVSLFLSPSGYTGADEYGGEPGSNGLALDREGNLISCEHGDRRISALRPGYGKRTVVDNYQGKRFNSPNDVVVHSNGSLYFTDPPYGLPEGWDDPRRELDFCGVYRYSPKGELQLLTKEMTRPNGIAFSPDEKTLYVAQSDPQAAVIKAFPVNADGSLGKSRVLYDATRDVSKLPGLPDGLKVAENGILFATGPGGVLVLTPEGKLLGRINTGEKTANCAFGGPEGSILYMTADNYICRIQTRVRGAGLR